MMINLSTKNFRKARILIFLVSNLQSSFRPLHPSFFINHSTRGFTIVELLVVLTLIGLVSGVGIFSLVNYGNTQTIEQAVGDAKGMLDEAKFNAISSVKLENDADNNTVSCIGNLISYRVDINQNSGQNPDSMDLYMICDDAIWIDTYQFPSSLNLTSGTTCNSVTYRAVNLNPSGDPVLPCQIEVEGFLQTKTILLDLLGNINVE